MGAVLRLYRRLAEQLLTSRERTEELIVEVVTVGEHDHCRVFHRRLADYATRIERHRQALAGALRVPHDADAPVAGLPARFQSSFVAALRSSNAAPELGRAQRLGAGCLHRVELVVAGH